MSEWIKGLGFYYVQPTGSIDEVANKKRMDFLEERLQAAELRFGIRKEQIA